jgi:hypothetical protein
VKGTKTARHDWSHDNMPHIPLTYLWCRLGSAPRQSATYASSAKLATLPTCLTQALRPVPHAAKQGLLTELKKLQADQARRVKTYTICKQNVVRGGQFDRQHEPEPSLLRAGKTYCRTAAVEWPRAPFHKFPQLNLILAPVDELEARPADIFATPAILIVICRT